MRHTVSSLVLLVGLAGACDLSAQQPAPAPIQQAGGFRLRDASQNCETKVCVTEMKATTKVVHTSACKDYCQPHSCLTDLLKSCFGRDCQACDCGTPKTYKVLMKKVVPGPSVPVCTVKEAAAPTWIQSTAARNAPKTSTSPLPPLVPVVVPAGGSVAPQGPLAPLPPR